MAWLLGAGRHPMLDGWAFSSKMNSHPAFLRYLYGYGREAADIWLASHLHEVGKQSTVDLAELGPLRKDYHFGLVTCPR